MHRNVEQLKIFLDAYFETDVPIEVVEFFATFESPKDSAQALHRGFMAILEHQRAAPMDVRCGHQIGPSASRPAIHDLEDSVSSESLRFGADELYRILSGESGLDHGGAAPLAADILLHPMGEIPSGLDSRTSENNSQQLEDALEDIRDSQKVLIEELQEAAFRASFLDGLDDRYPGLTKGLLKQARQILQMPLKSGCTEVADDLRLNVTYAFEVDEAAMLESRWKADWLVEVLGPLYQKLPIMERLINEWLLRAEAEGLVMNHLQSLRSRFPVAK